MKRTRYKENFLHKRWLAGENAKENLYITTLEMNEGNVIPYSCVKGELSVRLF